MSDKKKSSKLDQYAETLLEMDDQGKTLAEMQKWLKDEDVTISSGRLSEYLSSLRQERRQNALLAQIATGARQCEQVEAAFKNNPAAGLETLLKLHRVLILEMTTQGVTNPEMLSLANQMTQTVLQFAAGQTKAAFKEREVTLAEQKAAEARQDEQTKALAYCLEESKSYPEVQKQFRVAFDALKKAKATQTTAT